MEASAAPRDSRGAALRPGPVRSGAAQDALHLLEFDQERVVPVGGVDLRIAGPRPSGGVEYVPYHLNGGWSDKRKEDFGDDVVEAIEGFAPGFSKLIEHRQVISTLDYETEYGLSGGNISHGDMAFDQMFAMRPLLGWARYRSPIKNLYLCGAGAHPGGGIIGAPGRNAAREIIKDNRLRARR